MAPFFYYLDLLEDSLWTYIGFPALVLLGLLLCFKARFVQLREFHLAVKSFYRFLFYGTKEHQGVHPLKAFFACIGGCIGIGNLVAICTAVQIGGPGALFWVWMTAIIGMVIKYSEIYLGVRYRVPSPQGGYRGGPMYFLKSAFASPLIPSAVALLLCVYGIEIYQFNVVANSISNNFSLHPLIVSSALLLLVVYAGLGGVDRVGKISSAVIPLFMVLYMTMGCWVLFQNLHRLPEMFGLIFSSAFTGHAALGGFAGSTTLVAITQGIRRGCYTSDIGVGYASVIHSESSTQVPEKQAALAFIDIFIDTFLICTMSVFLILTTDVWKEPIHSSELVQSALAQYFPYMNFFIPLFLALLGYSTIIAYFCFGLKSAEYLFPVYGRRLFVAASVPAFLWFSFEDTYNALIVMSITQVCLIVLNVLGMYRLRREISYNLSSLENP